ncbi:hypothetical protein [Sphingomonas bacterium]|uniref:hypothetical protein n=1 Tax=Sphingomonas bacterium TaxID=1895847 RepID=UPI002620B5B8|nr:hypothetical protein [Sphingomonas bacterium]MDB5680036.1 hypothetical protein [Sphingomonas bacterium]
MHDFMQFLWLIAVIVFPFFAMAIMWRRMKNVRNRAYREADPLPNEPAWQEPIEAEHGLMLVRTQSPNDDLIALGAKAKQATWTLTNQ